MGVEHNFPQLSDEWFQIRAGKFTASLFDDLMPKDNAKKEWTEGQLGLLVRIASEILTGSRPETFTSKEMQWGIDKEGDAREALSDTLMIPLRGCGFFQLSEYAGASPDFVSENMDLTGDLKCPASKTHMTYLLDSAELWKKYRWQVVGQTLCTGIDRGVIASYDPRFPLDKQLVVHEPGDLSKDRERLQARLDSAVTMIKEWIK